MADFTVTVSNQIRSFGPAPSTKWGTGTFFSMTWGASMWGEGTETISKSVGRSMLETLTLSDAFTKGIGKSLSESIALVSETTSEGLKSGAWSYVFVSNVTEAENRSTSTYTSGTAATTTWSTATAASDNWS